jgi:hypothetical protein
MPKVKAKRKLKVSAAPQAQSGVTQACFNEEQCVDQGGGWFAVRVTSPAVASYGPGFPDAGQSFISRHGVQIQGPCWLEVLPDGRVFGYPLTLPDGPLGAWQLFKKQSGVLFVTPGEASFGFVYRAK